MHTEHDAPNSDVNPESLKQGHEPDKINVRLILYVPVAIFFTFVLAYVVVTVIIDNLREGHKTPGENLPATARNEAAMNDQLSRISSTNPKADVRQPRLEGLNELIKDGQSVQSNVPTKEGNSVQYHPEDLRPSAERWKILQEYGWRDKSKDIVRIPIMEAIKVLSAWENDKNAGDEKAKKAATEMLVKFGFNYEDKVNVQAIRSSQPTASNPQWGTTPPATQEQPKGGGH